MKILEQGLSYKEAMNEENIKTTKERMANLRMKIIEETPGNIDIKDLLEGLVKNIFIFKKKIYKYQNVKPLKKQWKKVPKTELNISF